MKRWIMTMLFAFLIVGTLQISHASGQFFFMENPMVGKEAPDFALKTLKGEETSLTRFRQDSPAIVFFWATWCPHCREQLRDLNTQGAKLEEKGIKIILVDLGEGANEVRRYVEKNKISYDVFLDTETTVAEQYGIVGVPTFFLLDKSGKVKAVEHSLPEGLDEILLAEGKKGQAEPY